MNSPLRIKIRNILTEYYDFYPDFLDPLYNPNVHGFIGFKDEQGKQSLGEEVIDEGATSFMDIPPNIGLIKREPESSRSWFHLFDFNEMKCVGQITLGRLSNRSYMITTIAAEKGFGPIMFEVGMMGVYPSGICLDRLSSSKEGVWNVFEKFANNRPEVRKIEIRDNDMEYDNRYLDDSESNEHILFNTILSRTPSAWFHKLLDRGERLSKEKKIDLNQISDICKKYFSNRYENG